VYFWDRSPAAVGVSRGDVMWRSEEWRLAGAEDVHQVLAWAAGPAGRGRPFELFVEAQNSESSLGVSHLGVTADVGLVGTVCGMSYSSDLTDEQWALLKPVFNAPGKRGPRHAPDLRSVVDAMLYISTPAASGGSSPSRSGPGRGCGRSSAAGRATAPGRGL
jgi:hypothetical protein